jgi:hypothetical protein
MLISLLSEAGFTPVALDTNKLFKLDLRTTHPRSNEHRSHAILRPIPDRPSMPQRNQRASRTVHLIYDAWKWTHPDYPWWNNVEK